MDSAAMGANRFHGMSLQHRMSGGLESGGSGGVSSGGSALGLDISNASRAEFEYLLEAFITEQSGHQRKAHVICQLRQTLRANSAVLKAQAHPKRAALMNKLAESLKTDDWDVALPCIQLLEEMISKLGVEENLDVLVAPIVPALVPYLGDKRITVRKNTVQAMHVYMRHTRNMNYVFSCVVKHGLDNPEASLRREVMLSLPILLTPEFSHVNFFVLVHGLAKMLLRKPSNSEDLLIPTSLMIMEKIRSLVGEEAFLGYLNKMSGSLKQYYDKLMEKKMDSVNSYAANYDLDHRVRHSHAAIAASSSSSSSSSAEKTESSSSSSLSSPSKSSVTSTTSIYF